MENNTRLCASLLTSFPKVNITIFPIWLCCQLRVAVRVALRVAVKVVVMVDVRVAVRVAVRVGVRVAVRVTVRVTVKVAVRVTVKVAVRVAVRVDVTLFSHFSFPKTCFLVAQTISKNDEIMYCLIK